MRIESFKTWFRNGFIVTALLGLGFNVVFDFLAFSQNEISDRSGKGVVASYQSQLALEELKNRISVNPKSEQQRHRISSDLLRIRQGAQSLPSRLLLSELETLIHTDETRALQILEEVYSFESEALREAIDRDRAQDQEVEASMRNALRFDFGLVILLLVLFALNLKAKSKTERNLKASLSALRGTLLTLEEESVRRRTLLKTTVHDLKSPFGSIMGFAQLLEDEATSKASVAEFSERIRNISERSLELVEEMLKSDDESQTQFAPLNMVSVLQDIRSQMEAQALAKKQTLVAECQTPVSMILGHRRKIEELTSNLISNAIKYSPEGTQITLRCTHDDQKCKVEIEDQGPGFTEEDRRQAFQYGQKLSAQPTANETSSGLGLFIAKQIVELHQGQIQIAEPKNGVGACITFEIPLNVVV